MSLPRRALDSGRNPCLRTLSSHATDFESRIVTPPTPSQLRMVMLRNAVPFVGFGFIDNFIMLVAGERIDTSIGVAFCTSTLFAAGIGNLVRWG